MAVTKKTQKQVWVTMTGQGSYLISGTNYRFEYGDQKEVPEKLARHLVENTGKFSRGKIDVTPKDEHRERGDLKLSDLNKELRGGGEKQPEGGKDPDGGKGNEKPPETNPNGGNQKIEEV